MLGKEKELQDLQKQEDAATDPETKRALQCIIEVVVDALKARFQREEVRGLQKYVLQERRRKAVPLKWCSDEQAEFIRSIWCRCLFPVKYPKMSQVVDKRHSLIASPVKVTMMTRISSSPK